MSQKTCELIMLDRDTCGEPAEKCPQCEKAFCSICINEHLKVHRPTPVEPKKIEVNLGICKICELVGAYANGRGCSACGSETEPLKAALKPDGTILFYTEGP
jgi:hypothetical protein